MTIDSPFLIWAGEAETNLHVFRDCSFAKNVWKSISIK